MSKNLCHIQNRKYLSIQSNGLYDFIIWRIATSCVGTFNIASNILDEPIPLYYFAIAVVNVFGNNSKMVHRAKIIVAATPIGQDYKNQ